MGVDLSTYRSRIGCFKNNDGSGFALICVNIKFYKAVTWSSIFAAITCLLGIVVSHKYSQTVHSEELFHFGVVDVLILSCGLICKHPCLALNQMIRTLKCIGVVTFIGMLLLLAGIEPNPGPNPRRDGDEEHNFDVNFGKPESLNDKKFDELSTENPRQIGLTQSEGYCKNDEDNSSDLQASLVRHYVEEDSHQLPTDCKETLELLELTKYIQAKLTFDDIMSLQMNDSDNITMSNLPRKLIQGLLTLNFEARDKLQNQINSEKQQTEKENDPFVDEEAEDEDTTISNLDIFIAVFDCCDSFLKQIIVNKMIMCRLAVPIIYPLMSSNKLCFSTWPLRSSTLAIKGREMEVSLTNHSMGIISFIRYDRPDLSKSHLINGILSNYSHPTFYHKDCDMGNKKKKISNGLVEASWYIPSSDDSEFSNEALMFLNLRGEARIHKQQTKFLKEISSVLVIIVDFQKVTDYISEIKAMNLFTSSIILLLSCNASTVGNKPEQLLVIKKCKSEIRGVNILPTFIKGEEKNASKLKDDLKNGIGKVLKNKGPCLEDCTSIANGLGIAPDEYTIKCKASKRLADTVFTHLKHETAFKKTVVLPLQGQSWKTFTELYKEAKKIGKDSLNDTEKSKEKLKEVHKLRTETCKSLPPFLCDFIKVIVNHIDDREVILYFLHWIKIYLDNCSRNVIPTLTSTFLNRLENSERSSEQKENASLEIQQAAQDIDDASLGLEHIFREIGQLYEAFKDKCLPRDIQMPFSFEDLPYIVSKILTFGLAFEIMDGDTGNIPKNWVKAVFKSLKSHIGDENKKLLVVSILGVQSSGKSTFLNTMYGLQFPVSAGRCTRGIYMQLLPVKTSDALSSVDFILILDTEGIRAPEFGLNTHSRDNELATLALGIADLTIINIKGENTAEVNDVLQIAVHAFLRLKLTNEKLELKQSCIFVHQNASDPNAEEKTREARRKLVQTLDIMTLTAAKHEHIADITTFQQVIDFDYRKNVWHFPDLWNGTPPMAHVNLGYSKKVMQVRAAVLKNVSTKNPRLLSISEFPSRVLDIWDGILTDDFVYSFRNNLEVKVYNAMERQYQRLTWEFEKYTSNCYSSTKDGLDGNESTDDTNKRIRRDFEDKTERKAKTIEEELVRYFDKNEDRKILIQWKESKLYFFYYFKSKMINKHIEDLKLKHQELQVEVKTKLSYSHYLEEITQKAEDLAKTFKGSKADTAEIESRFNEMWEEWLNSIPKVLPREETLEEEIRRILLDKYQGSLTTYLKEEINHLPLSGWPKNQNLTDDIDFICRGDKQISIKKFVINLINEKILNNPKKTARQFTERLFQEIDIYIQNLTKIDTKFERVYLSTILNIVDEKFKTHNDDGSRESFTFLPTYQAKVLVHICRYVVYAFKKINEEYNERHSPRTQMETHKKHTMTLFINLVSDKSPEGIAANMFCDIMCSAIKQKMKQRLALEFEECILENFNHSKEHMIIEILKDLADKNDFNRYMLYIADPKLYAMQWLNDHNVFTSVKSKIVEKSQNLIGTYICDITTSLEKAISFPRFNILHWYLDVLNLNRKKRNINRFMASFHSFLLDTDFNVPIRVLRQVCNYEIQSEKLFYDLVKKNFSEEEEKLNKDCEFIDMPCLKGLVFDNIVKRLWGCDGMCPFCNEPCKKINHDRSTNHVCVQHRPLVINGIIEAENNECMLGSCSFYVQTSKQFFCIASGLECQKSDYCKKEKDTLHEYKRYKRFLPQWDIPPSTDSSSSQYWCWVVVHFKSDLEKHHQLDINNIPPSWKTYNKDDAKRSLKEL